MTEATTNNAPWPVSARNAMRLEAFCRTIRSPNASSSAEAPETIRAGLEAVRAAERETLGRETPRERSDWECRVNRQQGAGGVIALQRREPDPQTLSFHFDKDNVLYMGAWTSLGPKRESLSLMLERTAAGIEFYIGAAEAEFRIPLGPEAPDIAWAASGRQTPPEATVPPSTGPTASKVVTGGARCPRCGQANPEQNVFCGACGARLDGAVPTCQSCGAPMVSAERRCANPRCRRVVRAGENFCSNCGEAVK